MKRNKLLLTALAVILALGVMIAPAMAYFTAHTEAQGAATIELGFETTIEEPEVTADAKTVVISNKGPESCYVRVQAFASDGIEVTGSGSDWTKDGDWWYYNGIVEAGGQTPELKLAFELPEGATEGQHVEIAVIHEAAKVLFKEDGSYLPATEADWELKPATTEGE